MSSSMTLIWLNTETLSGGKKKQAESEQEKNRAKKTGTHESDETSGNKSSIEILDRDVPRDWFLT